MTADNVRPLTGKDGKARAAAMAPTTAAEAAALEPVEEWPEVVPFEATEPPAPFPTDALPPVLARFVTDTSESLGMTPDLVAVSMLAAVSTVTGGRWSVEAPWRKAWREQAVLFIVGVAPPGSMKSAAMRAAMAPVADLQQELRERFAGEVAEALQRRELDEDRLKELRRVALKAKDSSERVQAEGEAVDLARSLAEQPVPNIPQLFTTDATPESMEVFLYRNGERGAWVDSEGGLWTMLSGRHASKPGAVSMEIFLKGFTGGEAVEVNRLGREGASLRSPALTIGMLTQPDHLRSAMANIEGGVGRGLFDRFLFSWPESSPVDRSQPATPVSSEVADAYAAAVRRLYQVAEAIPPGDRRVLAMNPDAADILQSFAAWARAAVEPGGDLDADGLKGWAEKLPGQVHRLAGMLTLIADPHADTVTADAAVGAVNLGHYFVVHARRTMMELGLDTGAKAARKCWEAIVHARSRSPRMWNEWPEVVTLQDVTETVKGNRSLGLDRTPGVEAALILLAEEYHLLRRIEDGKAGRKRWEVHPDHRPRR